MSRRQMSGSAQCSRIQSRRTCGELLCGLAGGLSSAKVNVSPFVFGIADLLGSFWGQGAAIDHYLLICAEVDRYDDPIGGVAGAFVSSAGGCPQLLGGFDAVARTGALVFQDSSEHCRGFGELLCRGFASAVTV